MSVRVPSVRVPSVRVLSVRVPSVRVPSVHVPLVSHESYISLALPISPEIIDNFDVQGVLTTVSKFPT